MGYSGSPCAARRTTLSLTFLAVIVSLVDSSPKDISKINHECYQVIIKKTEVLLLVDRLISHKTWLAAVVANQWWRCFVKTNVRSCMAAKRITTVPVVAS